MVKWWNRQPTGIKLTIVAAVVAFIVFLGAFGVDA